MLSTRNFSTVFIQPVTVISLPCKSVTMSFQYYAISFAALLVALRWILNFGWLILECYYKLN